MHQHIITSWHSLILLLGDSAQNNNQSVDKVGLNLQQESFIVYKVSADNEFTIIIKVHLHTGWSLPSGSCRENAVCVSAAGISAVVSQKWACERKAVYLYHWNHHAEEIILITSLCVTAEGGRCYIRLCCPQCREEVKKAPETEWRQLWILNGSSPSSSSSRLRSLINQWLRGRLCTNGIRSKRGARHADDVGNHEQHTDVVATYLYGFSVKIPPKLNKMEKRVVMTPAVYVEKMCHLAE